MVDFQRFGCGKSVHEVLLHGRFFKHTSRDLMLDAFFEVGEVASSQLFAQLKNKVRDPPVDAPDSYQTV